jgi:ferric-dicitrate binding protein FerR (iron transport regulator)
MNELEVLAEKLRSELGAAPASHAVQWRRLQHDERFTSPRRATSWRWVTGFALCAAALLLWVLVARDPRGSSMELAASRASLDHRLKDRSELHLEPHSRGRLDEGSHDTLFRLEAGKVRLNVTPQHDRRFEVLAAGYVVTVVGTRFAVWVETPGRVVVEVAEGVVTVTPPHGEPSVRLGAGERLDGDARGKITIVRGRDLASSNSRPALQEPDAESATAEPLAPPPSLATKESARVGEVTEPDWRAHFRARRYSEALAAARAIGVERLLLELDAGSLSDLADVARLGGDSSLNVRVLRTLRSRFPGTAQASRGAFLLGRALALGGNLREAALAFEAHLAEDPNGAHSIEALGRLMELYSDLGDRPRARSRAERYLERAPTGPYQRLARSLTAH